MCYFFFSYDSFICFYCSRVYFISFMLLTLFTNSLNHSFFSFVFGLWNLWMIKIYRFVMDLFQFALSWWLCSVSFTPDFTLTFGYWIETVRRWSSSFEKSKYIFHFAWQPVMIMIQAGKSLKCSQLYRIPMS